METQTAKYGRIVDTGDSLELRYLISDVDTPDTATEVTVVTWTKGDTNLVISVPHGGTVGSDTSPAGNILCETGHVIETRKCSPQFPSLTYTRDAGTDIIARDIQQILSKDGLKPHVIECHIHRSKVECNRHISEAAIQKRGQEAELVYETFHAWIKAAIRQGMEANNIGVLLIDLHGHGHPHEYIELGYRLSAAMLNNISTEEEQERNWRRIVTSSSRHEFTMRHLLKRRFGVSNDSIRDCLVGDKSFSACISRQFASESCLSNIKCVPSQARIGPGKLGYYNGGFIVRSHSKMAKVDSVQIELPMSVRSQPGQMRETAIMALAAAIKQFHLMHYDVSSSDSLSEERHVPNGTETNGEMMYLSDTDEEPETPSEPIPTSAGPVPGPPPPPPPPPPSLPAAPAPVSQDGVGQMAMMAKSRMHDELIRRAKRNLSPEEIQRQATPPSPPLHPPGPSPPPPPPPPPPPAPAPSTLSPDMADSITHMTAMSKSRMHQELITKAQKKPKSPSPSQAAATSPDTQSNTSNPTESLDNKILERKKLVQDLLEKQEPKSETRKLNEQRRREFFEGTPTTTKHSEEMKESEKISEENETIVQDIKIERPPRHKKRDSKIVESLPDTNGKDETVKKGLCSIS